MAPRIFVHSYYYYITTKSLRWLTLLDRIPSKKTCPPNVSVYESSSLFLKKKSNVTFRTIIGLYLPSNMVFWRVFLHVLFLIINFKNLLLLLQTNIFLEEFFRTNPTQTKYLIFEFISSRKKKIKMNTTSVHKEEKNTLLLS